jgi:hypothetical protein
MLRVNYMRQARAVQVLPERNRESGLTKRNGIHMRHKQLQAPMYFIMLLTLLFAGCMPDFSLIKGYHLGRPTTANVGDVIMAWGMQYNGCQKDVSGLKQTLSYSGIAQGVVYLDYREYATSGCRYNMARPAFNKELKYDTKQSTTITFQDIRIQILHANPERIAFIVVNGPYNQDVSQNPTIDPPTVKPISYRGSSPRCEDPEVSTLCPFFQTNMGLYRARCHDGSGIEARIRPDEPRQVKVLPPVNSLPQPWEAQRCMLASVMAN